MSAPGRDDMDRNPRVEEHGFMSAAQVVEAKCGELKRSSPSPKLFGDGARVSGVFWTRG